jgi:hypothetical protein
LFGGADTNNARSWVILGDADANNITYQSQALPALLAQGCTVASATPSGNETWLLILDPPS